MAARSIATRSSERTGIRLRNRLGLLACLTLALGCALAGCKTGVLPDPNDPHDVGQVAPDILRQNLESTSDSLNDRVIKGEISDSERRSLIVKRANELVAHLKLEQIEPAKAWEYAEVYRAAQRWKEADALLELAVKNAPSEDRRVNDSLRLAQVKATEGNVPEALRLARSTFDAPVTEKAPILPAVLYEIVPAAKGKGHDVELGKLLEDAIQQHQQVIVDPNTDAGRAFLAARPHHVQVAWETVLELFIQAHRTDLAKEAGQKAQTMMSGNARV